MIQVLITITVVLCLLNLHLYFASDFRDGMTTIMIIYTFCLLLYSLYSGLVLSLTGETYIFMRRALPIGMLYGPFLYFSFIILEKETTVSFSKIITHALPFLVWMVVFILFWFNSGLRHLYGVEYHIALYSCVSLSCFLYFLYCMFNIKKTINLSSVSTMGLSASLVLLLVYSLYIIMLVYFTYIVESTLTYAPVSNFTIILRVFIASLIFYKMFLMLEKKYQEMYMKKNNERGVYYFQDNKKYKKSQLTFSQLTSYMGKFEALVYDQQYFLNSEVHLDDIAQKIKVSPHDLSQVLSRGYGMNLLELVNRMRVEYACRVMCEKPEYTLTEVAEKSGFASESSFFRNFRKIKNMTPGQFKNKHR